MSSEDTDVAIMQCISGDAHILSNIPQEDTAVSNGTILSISLSDGKVMQNVFKFMKHCPDVYIQFSECGFSFIGMYINKQSKTSIQNDDQKPDMVFYKTFKKDKIPEYFFCPENLKLEMPDGKNILTICMPTNQIETIMKKSKPKSNTNMRFELNGKTGNFTLTVISGVPITYTLQYNWSRVVNNVIPGRITSSTLTPCFKFSSEIFSQIMTYTGTKIDNVAYDYRIAIHKGGIALKSDAPGTEPIVYGNMTECPNVFSLSNESTKYFSVLQKITPRATILMTSVDDTVFKLTYPISSFGEGYIFQFTKTNNSPMYQYQQPQYATQWQSYDQHTLPSVPPMQSIGSNSSSFYSSPQAVEQNSSSFSSSFSSQNFQRGPQGEGLPNYYVQNNHMNTSSDSIPQPSFDPSKFVAFQSDI